MSDRYQEIKDELDVMCIQLDPHAAVVVRAVGRVLENMEREHRVEIESLKKDIQALQHSTSQLDRRTLGQMMIGGNNYGESC